MCKESKFPNRTIQIMTKLITFCFVLLLVFPMGKLNYGASLWPFVSTNSKSSRSSKGKGAKIYPYFGQFKGFKASQGVLFSVDEYDKKTRSKSSLNFYYTKPALKNHSDKKITQYKFEYENRTYPGPGAYYGAAVGAQKINPNLALKKHFTALGEDARGIIKPYVSFRMGMKMLNNVPLFGTPAVAEVSYTVSDDYRFPSAGPHGFRKIPLKGFGASVNFKF